AREGLHHIQVTDPQVVDVPPTYHGYGQPPPGSTTTPH
ncbi:hypothetical protein UG55_10451, partial [Frankia sp. EI5c]